MLFYSYITKCDSKNDWLWVRSPLKEMKYLHKCIFTSLRSGVEAKRGVEFCHVTCNASRIRQKVGNGMSYTRFPLPTLLCARYSVKLIYFIFIYSIVSFVSVSSIFTTGNENQIKNNYLFFVSDLVLH